MDWLIEKHNIQNLFLDSKNIRIPVELKTQNALIQDLFTNEDAYDIVKSICHYGVFPDEFPIAVKEKNKIIILEGNRRIAALKALFNPEIVPAFKGKLKVLKNKKISEIKVVLAPSRDKATALLANKHTVNLRKPWKPLRQAYFYQSQIENGKTIKQLIKEYTDHDIVKFIKMLEMHKLSKTIKYDNSEIENKIHNERKFPITSLQRMYDDEQIRNFLGIDFNETGEVVGQTKLEEFQKGYKKIVEDVAIGNIDSRKYNSVTQRKRYLESFPKKLVPDTKKKGHFTTKSAKEIKPSGTSIAGTKTGFRNTRKLFQASRVPFQVNSSPLKLLYDELKKIEVKQLPNATHDLLRSFLECALVVFLKEKKEYNLVRKSKQHNPTLGEMLTHLMSKSTLISDSNIKQVIKQIKSDYSGKFSLERMNMINHNENWVTSEPEVRVAWAKMESLIKILLNPNHE